MAEMTYAIAIIVAALVVVAIILAYASSRVLSAIAERYQREGNPVDLGAGSLNVLEIGNRSSASPPLVLVHGATANLKDLKVSLGERLARDNLVVLVDRPGHGWSDALARDDGHSPEGHAVAINQALSRLGAERPILVGHGWGGAVVLSYALAYPEDLAGVVAIAPLSHPSEHGVARVHSLAAMPVLGWLFCRLLVPAFGRLHLARWTARAFAPRPVPADHAEAVALPLVLRPANFRNNARDLVALDQNLADQARYYGQIRVPTVVIAGDQDRVAPMAEHASRLAGEIDNARLVVLNDVGHMAHHVSPNVIAFEINRLVERLWSQPQGA